MIIHPNSDGTREFGVMLQESNSASSNSRFTAKAQRCHKDVKKRSPGANEYAVCTASMGYGESYKQRSQRKAREAAEPVRVIEYNKCHSPEDGKFCSTSGGGDVRKDGRDNYRSTYKSASDKQVSAEWNRPRVSRALTHRRAGGGEWKASSSSGAYGRVYTKQVGDSVLSVMKSSTKAGDWVGRMRKAGPGGFIGAEIRGERTDVMRQLIARASAAKYNAAEKKRVDAYRKRTNVSTGTGRRSTSSRFF